MLDINLIRNDPEGVADALGKRMDNVDFTELLQMDGDRRVLIADVEKLKADRNRASSEIPKLKKAGDDVTELLAEMKSVSESIKEMDGKIRDLDAKLQHEIALLPNIPDDDVLAGGKEANQVIRTWGAKPEFGFGIKDHVDMVTSLGLVDYDRGVKMGGNGFWLYKGVGALIEWALLNYFIDTHVADGYELILPPHILTYESGFTAGQFPKFEDDVFQIASEDERFKQFLLPTSETALINYHRDEILSEDDLPRKYCAYSPCYRREAGSYRAKERGMIRGHQFNKIEMFQFTRPDDSEAALDELIGRAEKLVQDLGLHYQVSKLAAKDASASMAKTYDIEVWMPSMDAYVEVSSASNARDYQARRGSIRFRREGQKQTEFVHSLNASGLATSRMIPAIVENFQQADGSVVLPEVLASRVGSGTIQPS